MLNEIGKTLFDVEKGNVLEIVKVFNSNFEQVVSQVNESCEDIRVNHDVLCDCMGDIDSLFDEVKKLGKKKAGKLGLILMGVAGLAYIIKNEIDKDKMKTKLIQLDKDARGCEQFYTPTEDEGEATEPMN